MTLTPAQKAAATRRRNRQQRQEEAERNGLALIAKCAEVPLPTPPDPFAPTNKLLHLEAAYQEEVTLPDDRAYAAWALGRLVADIFYSMEIPPNVPHWVDARIRSRIVAHLIWLYPGLAQGAEIEEVLNEQVLLDRAQMDPKLAGALRLGVRLWY